ncbi:unnamed protein product [Lactuca virosa]|uniref:MADF domain-containing protein n=1 Tax=Lactuca virosa TaxID=75947 RepID=A0AAU9N0N5_9ASTR|nr:unnamed protein product [Lactuca virosa]
MAVVEVVVVVAVVVVAEAVVAEVEQSILSFLSQNRYPLLQHHNRLRSNLSFFTTVRRNYLRFEEYNESPTKEREECQTIGNNIFEFTTYCGVTVRTRISILKQWNEVPQPEIDELWLNIKTHWNIPNDDYKAQVLKVCNKQWRSYKSKLVKFMDKRIDPLEK